MKLKGFSIAALGSLAIVFVVATIIIAFGAQILGEIRADQTNATWENNVTISGLDALSTFGDWLPTLALVVVAAIIIGVVVMYLGRQTGKGA